MSSGGLARGTDDFKAVLAAFNNKTYSIHNYDPQAILHSNPDWARKYDPQAFAESVRNLVANLRLTPPEFPDREANQHLPDPEIATNIPKAQIPKAQLMSPTEGIAPPGIGADDAGIEMVSDQRLLVTPKQVVSWVDTSSNQNSRVTIYVMLPPGFAREHYRARIASGGEELLIEYVWPEEMLDPSILMRGHDLYDDGHNKIVAFNEHVKRLRGYNTNNNVESICRIALPFQVEEQFCGEGVPRPSYVTTTQNGHKVLAVELMGLRGNYQTVKVEQEYDSPPRGNSGAENSGRSTTGVGLSSGRSTGGGRSSSVNRGGSSSSNSTSYATNTRAAADAMATEDEAELERQRLHEIEMERRRQEHELYERQQQQKEERQRARKMQQQQEEEELRQRELEAEEQKLQDAQMLREQDERRTHQNSPFNVRVRTIHDPDEESETEEDKKARKEAILKRREEKRLQREREEQERLARPQSSQALASEIAKAANARTMARQAAEERARLQQEEANRAQEEANRRQMEEANRRQMEEARHQ